MADVQIENISASALEATDKALVRRAAGPLDHTIALVDLGGAAVLDVGTGAGTVAAGDHTHSAAVAAGASGFMTGADKTKLDGIASGAQVNVATDLTYTAATRVLASSTGTDATLPLVSSGDAGLAPASGGGTTNFLRADGTWAAAGAPASLGLWDWWYDAHIAKTGTLANDDIFVGAAISSGTNTTALPTRPSYMNNGVFIRSSTTANAGYRYNSSREHIFNPLSFKYQCQFLWRTSFTGRLALMGMSNSANIDTTANFLVAFFQSGTDVYGRVKNVGTASDTSTYTLSLDTAYTFDIEVDGGATEARFRIYAGTSTTAVFDQTLTSGIPYGGTVRAAFTEASTTASDIGVLSRIGMGTVEGFNRLRGVL